MIITKPDPDCTWQEPPWTQLTIMQRWFLLPVGQQGQNCIALQKLIYDHWSWKIYGNLEISMPLMPCNNEQIISDILLSCQTHLFWGCQGTQLLAGLPGGFNPWNFLWRFPTPWLKQMKAAACPKQSLQMFARVKCKIVSSTTWLWLSVVTSYHFGLSPIQVFVSLPAKLQQMGHDVAFSLHRLSCRLRHKKTHPTSPIASAADWPSCHVAAGFRGSPGGQIFQGFITKLNLTTEIFIWDHPTNGGKSHISVHS